MRREGKVYNTSVAIDKKGTLVNMYDKVHLFGLFNEERFFAPGNNFKAYELDGVCCGSTICYDLRFPVWSRNVGNDYDLLLVPANWPQSRSYAWQHLLIARAIENQACVVGANRCGRAGNDVYDHQSFIFNHLGQPATGATPPPFCANIPGTEVLIATLSLDQIQKYRRAFPAAADADSFSITL